MVEFVRICKKHKNGSSRSCVTTWNLETMLQINSLSNALLILKLVA